jgi:protein tyrosine/serine phosphatase
VRFLKTITDTNAGPFLVHCQHGADRTGTMIAIYRMAVQGWRKEEAIQEMTTGDFGYHTVWGNLIRYLNALDVEALRKQAGIKFTPSK